MTIYQFLKENKFQYKYWSNLENTMHLIRLLSTHISMTYCISKDQTCFLQFRFNEFLHIGCFENEESKSR